MKANRQLRVTVKHVIKVLMRLSDKNYNYKLLTTSAAIALLLSAIEDRKDDSTFMFLSCVC